MSKDSCDADYEASRIQTFISKFKDWQIKKIKQKMKKTRRQNRKIDRSYQKEIKMCYLFD